MKIEPRMRFDNLLNKTVEHFKLGRLSQQDVTKGDSQEEETMNDNLNTPEFKPVPYKLTDAEVEKLLATKESFDGPVAYLTDADETADEATPTLH